MSNKLKLSERAGRHDTPTAKWSAFVKTTGQLCTLSVTSPSGFGRVCPGGCSKAAPAVGARSNSPAADSADASAAARSAGANNATGGVACDVTTDDVIGDGVTWSRPPGRLMEKSSGMSDASGSVLARVRGGLLSSPFSAIVPAASSSCCSWTFCGCRSLTRGAVWRRNAAPQYPASHTQSRNISNAKTNASNVICRQYTRCNRQETKGFTSYVFHQHEMSVMGCLHDPANVQQLTFCFLNTFAGSLLDVCWIV